MDEKRYKKKLEVQQKIISRQLKQIEDLESQVQKLKLELKDKDEIINSITPLRNELLESVADANNCKKQYKELINELRKMKDVFNQEVFKGRWHLIKLLIK